MSPKNLLLLTILSITSFTVSSQTQVADYLNINSGNGKGIRFWNGNESYKISMGNTSEYKFGSVTDYSIKFSMNSDITRGWTWGVTGLTPVASLNTQGKLHLASDLSTLGKIGVGTTSPSALFHLNRTNTASGNNDYTFKITAYCNDCSGSTWYPFYIAGYNQNVGIGVVGGEESFANDPYNFQSSKLKVATTMAVYQRTSSTLHYVRISANNGNSIVTNADADALWIKKDDNALQNLAVEKLYAREVEVTSGTYQFPDYVFEDSYDLLSIDELDSYIQENKHLPNIPSAKEVEETGLKLGEMNIKLVEKIEELTLYIIELKKQNDLLAEKVEALENSQKK